MANTIPDNETEVYWWVIQYPGFQTENHTITEPAPDKEKGGARVTIASCVPEHN